MLLKTILCFSIFFLALQIPSYAAADESCYKMGYRYGLCSTNALLGFSCKSENDFVMPKKCRNKEETVKGINAGVKRVYAKQNQPTNTFTVSPTGSVTRNIPIPISSDETRKKGMDRVNAIILNMNEYKKNQPSNKIITK